MPCPNYVEDIIRRVSDRFIDIGCGNAPFGQTFKKKVTNQYCAHLSKGPSNARKN